MDMRICYLDIWILLAVVKLGQETILLPQVVRKFEIKKKLLQFYEKIYKNISIIEIYLYII